MDQQEVFIKRMLPYVFIKNLKRMTEAVASAVDDYSVAYVKHFKA